MGTNLIIETVEQPAHAPVATPPPEQSAWKQHWKMLLGVALSSAVCVIAAFVLFSSRVSTDDAQVDSHISSVSPRISGYIDKILRHDNQTLAAGELLARLHTRD